MTKNKDPKNEQVNSYDVGFGKPPRENQFKKGHSGNLRGRPRKTTESIDVVSVIEQPVSVKVSGTKRDMHPFEAGLRQLVRKALNDKKPRAVIDLLKQFEAHGLFKQPEVAQQGGVIFAPKGITPQEYIKQCNDS